MADRDGQDTSEGPVLTVPELSLVVLVGASGAGKTTFARRAFAAPEVLSSDAFRAMVSNEVDDQSATPAAFEALHFVARKRLERGLLTVVDATNVDTRARQPLVALAREHHVLPVAIVLALPESVCLARDAAREDRTVGKGVVREQARQLRSSLRRLRREGFRYVHVLSSEKEVDAARVERTPSWTDRRGEQGPFDIVGDVHGCASELRTLVAELGYEVVEAAPDETGPRHEVRPPRDAEGRARKLVFLGDLVDRGPDSPGVLRLVMDAVQQGAALCVPGNHDTKLLRKLRGREVKVSHGLAETLEQLEREPAAFVERVVSFLDGLVSHYVLDRGRLVVAHAGMPAAMQGRASRRVRDFALYGDTTGETDEYGLPVRYPWARDYRGSALVVYGHTPVPAPDWLNDTVNVDTGCVFGGRLTALRYPERELVSVPAEREHYPPAKPFLPGHDDGAGLAGELGGGLTAQQQHDDLLDLEDVRGRRVLHVSLPGAEGRRVKIDAEQAAAALEAVSRFAVSPKWLVHLPPTMSPPATSSREGLLEHPDEAFAYYRRERVERVVCEEKHMGSRAILVVCRDEEAARRRFGVVGEGAGVVFTRTGRPFFADRETQDAVLGRVRGAMFSAGWWERFETDWAVLDAELMPWSAKAQELLRRQYAPAGAAAEAALGSAVELLARAAERGVETGEWHDQHRERLRSARLYRDAYRRYCWPVESVDDLRLAPFHLLATEGRLHADRDHVWHMGTLAELAAQDGLLQATAWREVDLGDEESVAAATGWWEELTASGGEGMVVKPRGFLDRGRRGLVQPAVKCRGAEYLRIIYGPEYRLPENLSRLRERGLSRKRALAMREFLLGLEALRRFVAGEPLRRVHECVFGVLAMEAEPVDPRL